MFGQFTCDNYHSALCDVAFESHGFKHLPDPVKERIEALERRIYELEAHLHKQYGTQQLKEEPEHADL